MQRRRRRRTPRVRAIRSIRASVFTALPRSSGVKHLGASRDKGRPTLRVDAQQPGVPEPAAGGGGGCRPGGGRRRTTRRWWRAPFGTGSDASSPRLRTRRSSRPPRRGDRGARAKELVVALNRLRRPRRRQGRKVPPKSPPRRGPSKAGAAALRAPGHGPEAARGQSGEGQVGSCSQGQGGGGSQGVQGRGRSDSAASGSASADARGRSRQGECSIPHVCHHGTESVRQTLILREVSRFRTNSISGTASAPLESTCKEACSLRRVSSQEGPKLLPSCFSSSRQNLGVPGNTQDVIQKRGAGVEVVHVHQ